MLNILLGGLCRPVNGRDWSPSLFKRIFLYTTSRIGYRLRYRSKLRQRTTLGAGFELRTLPSNHKNEGSMPESRHERYISFLNYDVLMLIVRELHFVDVINWSQASRGMRDAPLPETGIAARTQALRSHTCRSHKFECSICKIQIFHVRQNEREIRLLLI